MSWTLFRVCVSMRGRVKLNSVNGILHFWFQQTNLPWASISHELIWDKWLFLCFWPTLRYNLSQTMKIPENVPGRYTLPGWTVGFVIFTQFILTKETSVLAIPTSYHLFTVAQSPTALISLHNKMAKRMNHI